MINKKATKTMQTLADLCKKYPNQEKKEEN